MDTHLRLDDVLRDLRSRRGKLSLLADHGAELDPAALLAEIGDLSERLLAADAELLARQEQLESQRAELERRAATLSTRTEQNGATVTKSAGPATDKPLLDLCHELSYAATRQATVTELAQFIAGVAADLASTAAAAVAVTHAPKVVTVEATGESAREAAASQFAAHEGPTYEAMANAEPRECGSGGEQKWPTHMAYLEGLGLRHELAIPMHCRNVRATVSVFSPAESAVSPDIRERLGLFARHAGSVLAQADVEANLRVAVETRQQVGQAVGILVERHRITPPAAFDRLVRASNITQTKLRDLAALLIETGAEPPES